MKKPKGMPCGQDPYWVCEDDLKCIHGRCKTPIDQGDRCDRPDVQGAACKPPMGCVGPTGKRRCFPKKTIGMRCGVDPYWVCLKWLTCVDGICVKHVGEGVSCEKDIVKCRDPLKCVGPAGSRKCYAASGPGGACGATLFCDTGLSCLGGWCF